MSIRILVLVTLLVTAFGARSQDGLPFEVESIADFDEPWATTFLPDAQ